MNGTLAATLLNATLSATGAVKIQGTLARTLGALVSGGGGPIMREEDWPTTLIQMIYDAAGIPFAWGTHDCCTWSADVIKAYSVGAIDIMAPYRGTYSDAASAAAVIAAATGGGDLEDLVQQIAVQYGLNEFPPAFAQRGDLALYDSPTGPAMGIVSWDATATFVSPGGLISVPLTDPGDGVTVPVRRSWRVSADPYIGG